MKWPSALLHHGHNPPRKTPLHWCCPSSQLDMTWASIFCGHCLRLRFGRIQNPFGKHCHATTWTTLNAKHQRALWKNSEATPRATDQSCAVTSLKRESIWQALSVILIPLPKEQPHNWSDRCSLYRKLSHLRPKLTAIRSTIYDLHPNFFCDPAGLEFGATETKDI